MRPWELRKEAWKNDAGSRGCWCSSRQFLGATLVQHIHLWFKVCCSSFFLAWRGSTLVTQKLMHQILTLKLWNSLFTMIWRSLFMVWHIIPLSYKKVILKVFFWWNEGAVVIYFGETNPELLNYFNKFYLSWIHQLFHYIIRQFGNKCFLVWLWLTEP